MTDKVQKIREEIERLRNEVYIDKDEADSYARNALRLVERFIDSLPEEHVSEELEKAYKRYTDDRLVIIRPDIADMSCDRDTKMSQEVFDGSELEAAFYEGAQWQEQKDFQYLKKEAKEFGFSCDENIAIEATKRHPCHYASETESYANIGFKEGASWMKQQMMKDAIDAAVNTYEELGGEGYVEFVANVPPYPYKEKMTVKLIIIKEE